VSPPTVDLNGPTHEVLTLGEAAAYLRLSEPELLRLVHEQDLPGRFTGTGWRFSKTALQQWLGQSLPMPSKEAQLAGIGAWKDDPYLEEMLKETYRKRRQPRAEVGE
jgi:excisionase family DNA binding protein